MNCEQANNIDLMDILERMGFKPQKKIGKEYQFTSPFRPFEKRGSFFVSHKGWYDQAEGIGSTTVVDFIKKYLDSHGRASSVSDSLKFIKSLGYGGGDTIPLFISASTPEIISDENSSDLEFIREKPVTHPAIFNYLQERGILKSLIEKHLVEVDYMNKKLNKVFFAFAVLNELGGYEIRSSSSTHVFKSSLIAKSFTFFEGQGASSAINIFEGITDYLSLLTLLNCQSLKGDSLVLNSLSSAKKSIAFINSKKYEKTHLWLDLDESGIKMASRFQNELHGAVIDESYRYSPFKDVNLALQAQNRNEYLFDLTI